MASACDRRGAARNEIAQSFTKWDGRNRWIGSARENNSAVSTAERKPVKSVPGNMHARLQSARSTPILLSAYSLH